MEYNYRWLSSERFNKSTNKQFEAHWIDIWLSCLQSSIDNKKKGKEHCINIALYNRLWQHKCQIKNFTELYLWDITGGWMLA